MQHSCPQSRTGGATHHRVIRAPRRVASNRPKVKYRRGMNTYIKVVRADLIITGKTEVIFSASTETGTSTGCAGSPLTPLIKNERNEESACYGTSSRNNRIGSSSADPEASGYRRIWFCFSCLVPHLGNTIYCNIIIYQNDSAKRDHWSWNIILRYMILKSYFAI